jgi:hypothetical protein
MMALQRKLPAGLHHNAFHLIAFAAVDTLVPTPRSIHAVMLKRDGLAFASGYGFTMPCREGNG